MATSLAQKLKIKEGASLCAINAPSHFKQKLQPLPPGVSISTKTKGCDQIHWFVENRLQMEKELSKILAAMVDGMILWIYYPKGSSKIQTDLARDKGWEALLAHSELQWLSLISFDDTWSAFAVRLKTDADKKKDNKPKPRAIFEYIDVETKTIRLPADFEKLLAKNKAEKKFFESLSFTNRKEYVEWIVTAKREETRNHRMTESIERLSKKWKNPVNR
ncbi:MAG TPA: YdeI/OmpD-associated family protein [Parafilimonas sp.]|nr:YdeI/OmpD-associated family protein [Parafilimonas sp.]